MTVSQGLSRTPAPQQNLHTSLSQHHLKASRSGSTLRGLDPLSSMTIKKEGFQEGSLNPLPISPPSDSSALHIRTELPSCGMSGIKIEHEEEALILLNLKRRRFDDSPAANPRAPPSPLLAKETTPPAPTPNPFSLSSPSSMNGAVDPRSMRTETAQPSEPAQLRDWNGTASTPPKESLHRQIFPKPTPLATSQQKSHTTSPKSREPHRAILSNEPVTTRPASQPVLKARSKLITIAPKVTSLSSLSSPSLRFANIAPKVSSDPLITASSVSDTSGNANKRQKTTKSSQPTATSASLKNASNIGPAVSSGLCEPASKKVNTSAYTNSLKSTSPIPDKPAAAKYDPVLLDAVANGNTGTLGKALRPIAPKPSTSTDDSRLAVNSSSLPPSTTKIPLLRIAPKPLLASAAATVSRSDIPMPKIPPTALSPRSRASKGSNIPTNSKTLSKKHTTPIHSVVLNSAPATPSSSSSDKSFLKNIGFVAIKPRILSPSPSPVAQPTGTQRKVATRTLTIPKN